MTNRRRFLKTVVCAGGASAVLSQAGCRALDGFAVRTGRSMAGFRATPLTSVRVGLIGVGNRGSAAIKRLAMIPGVEIRAVGDLHESRVATQVNMLTTRGKPAPKAYYGSAEVWRKMCESQEIDLIYICTPWLWHTPMAIYAMQCGKHAVTEVPAAMTIEQCWQLVDTAEQTRRHCMMLENCCYGEDELFALNLCRKDVLGELVHGEAAYIHDLRDSNLKEADETGKRDQWRLQWAKQHTGNPYPTHGLGPVCQYMGINRGDRFDYLTSISSDQLGLTRAAAKKFGSNSHQAKTAYKLGDMNTTVIKTYRGRTIMVQHDTTSPRPYSRLNLISGTKGILAGYPLRVALDPQAHDWLDPQALTTLKTKYAHPLWTQNRETALKQGGHGGMDFLMDLRLMHCLQQGLPLDIDVYDSALWSSLVALTEQSVLRKGASVTCPDFTRGGWKTAEPLGIVSV